MTEDKRQQAGRQAEAIMPADPSQAQTDRVYMLDAAHLNFVDNYRAAEDEAQIADLVASIADRGQDTPILVRQARAGDGAGAYTIVYGHRRARACARLNRPVRAMIAGADETDRDLFLKTMAENMTRRDPDAIAEARAIVKARDEHNMTIDQIARAIGQKADWIDRRLALLNLLPEYQHLVKTGALGISYAYAMRDLLPEYQQVAMRYYRDNGDRLLLPQWIAICGDLLQKQAQLSLNFGMFGDGAQTLLAELEDKHSDLPADPSQAEAPFETDRDLLPQVESRIDDWQQARDDWQKIGNSRKAEAAEARALQLETFAIALRAQAQQAIADRIVDILAERGDLTTGAIYRYANVSKAEASPAIDRLLLAGRIARRPAGRGFEYSLA